MKEKITNAIFGASSIIILAAILTLISCNGNTNRDSSFQQESQHQASESEINESDINENGAGTYRFTDGRGASYTLSLKSDGSVKLSGNGNEFYGSWKDYSNYSGYLSITFSDPKPFTTSDKVITTTNTLLSDGCLLSYSALKEGYLYFSADDAKANNPNHRFSLKQ